MELTDPGASEHVRNIVRVARFAADAEALKPRPVSAVPGPDGRPMGETPHEFTVRITEAAVMHLIEQGLLVMPVDIGERLNRWIPVERQGVRVA